MGRIGSERRKQKETKPAKALASSAARRIFVSLLPFVGEKKQAARLPLQPICVNS
jgi:hypothetical protein